MRFRTYTHGLFRGPAGILLLLPLIFGVSARASQPPDFSGKWQINHDKSDDARTKIREATSGGSGFGRRGGMGGGGWPGRQGGGYGTPPFGGGNSQGYPQGGGSTQGGSQDGSSDGTNGQSGDDQQQRQQRRAGNFAYLLNEPQTLDISDKEPVFTMNQTFAEDQGQGQPGTRTIYTDGRSMDQKDAQGDQQQSTAKWNGKKLVVAIKNDRGTITETYELESGGKELKVTTKVENTRLGRSVTVKRVYDQAKADAPKAN
ncbi:MAG TPA: hypothetical protein VI756_30680 [Blastocatellia bacterium]